MTGTIYEGTVVHSRLRPKRHKLAYRVFTLLLDLDQLDATPWRVLGINRAAPLSFWEADHGDGVAGDLRHWVGRQLDAAGIDLPGARVQVLCYPRIFGYVFNPLTVYFCKSAAGKLEAIIYEVCNTFGERRAYVLPARGDGAVEQSCDKELYVSPFVPMACRYHFHIEPPAEKVLVRIDETDAEGLLLRASFAGAGRTISDRALLRLLLVYPLMTLKVIVAIHWEALRLWAKGVPFLGRRTHRSA